MSHAENITQYNTESLALHFFVFSLFAYYMPSDSCLNDYRGEQKTVVKEAALNLRDAAMGSPI